MLWWSRVRALDRGISRAVSEKERLQPKLLTECDPSWPFSDWPFRDWPFSPVSKRSSGDPQNGPAQAQRCLWLMGPADLLHPDIPKVAIIGTRHPEPDIEEHIRQLARKIAEHGHVIVSGFAPGIDRAAFEGALEAENGRTIAVLAEGLDGQRLPRRLRDVERDPRQRDRVLIVSPFPPSTPWSGKNAMLRNLLIVALASVVIVGQAGPEETPRETAGRPRKSGTWHAVRKANEIHRRVLVPATALPVDHNQELVRQRLAAAWAEDVSELERLVRASDGVSSRTADSELSCAIAFDGPALVEESSLARQPTTQLAGETGQSSASARKGPPYQQASLPGLRERQTIPE